MMRLPKPIVLDGIQYTEVKLQSPNAGAIASAKREADRGDPYLALAEFCAGCVESLSGPDGETLDVRRAMRMAPWRDAVMIALYGRAEMNGDDGIASVVKCPGCGNRQRLEKTQDGDTRDFLYQLPVTDAPDGDTVTVVLKEPLRLKKRSREGEVEIEIASVTIRYPTIMDCSKAWISAQRDEGRAQIYTLAEALVALDGDEPSPAEKATFGRLVFERMKMPDMVALSEAINAYGLQPEVKRFCPACGEEWEEDVNVMGFFTSALK